MDCLSDFDECIKPGQVDVSACHLGQTLTFKSISLPPFRTQRTFTDLETAQPILAEKRMVITLICDENQVFSCAQKALHFSLYEDHI